MIIAGIVGAALFIAGAAYAAERTGGDREQENDRSPMAQNVDRGEGQDGQNINEDGRRSMDATGTPRQLNEQEMNKEREQNREDGRSTSSEQEMNKEREQNREGDQNASSSDREMNKEREQNREEARSATSSEDQENATSTEGERMREQHRSAVATAVQNLLQVADRTGGIGEEVRTIAQNQVKNQEKIAENLKKADERNAFVKFLFGADYGALNDAKQAVAENDAQIKQLTDVRSRITDPADQAVIDNQIKLLSDANALASTTVTNSDKGFSLLGWAFRLFGR